MAEIRTVTTLETKRRQICQAIARYEQLLAQARVDLGHVTAAIHLFQVQDVAPADIPAYADVHRLYKHRELITICKEALAKLGPLNTRELAAYALETKGLDSNDKMLAKSVANRIIHAMRMQHSRGKVRRLEKRGGVCIWAIAPLNSGDTLSLARM